MEEEEEGGDEDEEEDNEKKQDLAQLAYHKCCRAHSHVPTHARGGAHIRTHRAREPIRHAHVGDHRHHAINTTPNLPVQLRIHLRIRQNTCTPSAHSVRVRYTAG